MIPKSKLVYKGVVRNNHKYTQIYYMKWEINEYPKH